MKISKYILTGLLALGMATSANAYTLHITGSTAIGKALNQAILDYYGAAGTTTLPVGSKWGYSGTDALGNKKAIYTDGTNFIVTSMTGSEAGIQAVAWTGSNGGPVVAQPVQSYYNDADAALVATLTQAGTSNPTGTVTSVNHIADVAMADTQQSASRFNGTSTYGVYAALTSAGASTAVKGVGAIQFTWIASNGGKFIGAGPNVGNSMTGTITNINDNQIQYLYKTAESPFKKGVKAGMFTGVASDDNYRVYGIGRNIGSGTRLTTFVVAGMPANGVVVQFLPTDSTGTGLATTITNGNSAEPTGLITSVSTTPNNIWVWPAASTNYVTTGSGDSGYDSGGNLAKGLGANYSSIPMANTPNGAGDKGLVLVGYAGTGDAVNTLAGSGVYINYNGVAYSDAAIIAGQYTFWSWEHMYYNGGTIGTGEKTAADGVAAKLLGGEPNMITVTAMGSTTRAFDGALVTH
jgi:hypothetical protein